MRSQTKNVFRAARLRRVSERPSASEATTGSSFQKDGIKTSPP